MHTSQGTQSKMFKVRSTKGNIEPLAFMDMAPNDRFGIVVNQPFGGLGAGLLISLASAAWYDAPGRDRRTRNLYPEIYLFHAGGPWGNHSAFDFWPEGKEVLLSADPVEMLRAINFHGITHLAVPDCPVGEVLHRYREPEIAAERIRRCFAYSPCGNLDDADFWLDTDNPGVIWNFAASLKPELYVEDMERSVRDDPEYQADTAMATDFRRVISYLRERWHEVDRNSQAFREAEARIDEATSLSALTESYREIDLASALGMLGSASSNWNS